MLQITRTNSDNPDFIALVKLLDADLAVRDGDDHAFYAQFNKTAQLPTTIVAYVDGVAAGSGALRELEPGVMEVKRMYTLPAFRRQGIAVQVLAELEKWAAELGYQKTRLETGKNQPEAIAMYHRAGYTRIPNYGQYQQVDNSVCFEKTL